ncbi:NOB1 family endonuclease [Methanonatronarchaeum sp. AMET6-2]|uniref:NOB1 family endonuclease n=1 Tax=Methanonatronarchaeum sp. AMET6-2 TaxID=2933293 RepID=UPI0011FCA62D|nr:NOB1 family endonuclease [Methanonatronarchaeum sp. AMET6-2]RZN63090.1 MAG: NOB1 family endonuclease [Methanonatronarchaeia archaeon]UOY09955.1 NOB1 family endonuclease [Methanonatronarchaeum sp. AMET6-2]
MFTRDVYLNGMTETYVADTTVFITGKLPEGRVITTERVKEEVRDRTSKYNLNRDIKTDSVLQKNIKEIEEAAETTGDISRLSQTDIELLALAHQLNKTNKKVILVSDDYSIQNVAEKKDIEYRGVQQKKIDRQLTWGYRCLGCKREYSQKDIEDCPVCGSELEERILKRKDIVDD